MKPKRKAKLTKTDNWSYKDHKADPTGCVYVDKKPRKKRLRKDQREPELVAKTFDEWSTAGYRISKGAKSQTRNLAGIPLFGIDQVWKPGESFKPAPTSKPKSSFNWSQPSGLVKEVLERLAKKEETEDAAHMHMPESFEPNEDNYEDLPY